MGHISLSFCKSQAGMVSLGGVLVSLFGIVLVGSAGMSKENELPEEQKKAAVAEFNFKKGITGGDFLRIDECGHEFRPARRTGNRKARTHSPNL